MAIPSDTKLSIMFNPRNRFFNVKYDSMHTDFQSGPGGRYRGSSSVGKSHPAKPVHNAKVAPNTIRARYISAPHNFSW